MSVRATRLVRLRWAASDSLVMARRNLRRYVRVPSLVVFSTVQPVMFVLLFAFVFGGAIHTPGVDYIDFLMPGIFIQSVVFDSTATGVGLADDMSKGLMDRFRSLPMARSAVLAGRTLADGVRSVFVIVLMCSVGLLVGFRIHGPAPVVAFVLGLVLILVVGFAFSWISAFVGMGVRDPETAQMAGFTWLFPVTFASSVFVPVASMPGWLQVFARANPVTNAVDALRGIYLGGETAANVGRTLAWSAVIIAVFAPLAVRRYRRAV